MIPFAIAVASASLTAFAVMVASIRRTERCQSLFEADRLGVGDAITRKVLGLRTENPGSKARR